MGQFHFRRITDAVHGTFGISELESDIISTRVFQRLHNVKQLGLAHLVYPDLNYSRFAHSLGACHVAGRMLDAINLNCPQIVALDGDQAQLYRLAALLHDLGHYPFSHAMEHVIEDHYKEEAFLTNDEAAVPGGAASTSQAQTSGVALPAFGHETLGRRIIDLDPEIDTVLRKHGFPKEKLKAAFSHEEPGSLATLVSSDLDCDRLDYLMRTARHAGLPYGAVDADYLIGQTCVDSEGHVCLAKNALRAADHLLVSRYFDYTQVVYHKTVVGLEEVLKDTLKSLLQSKRLDCSAHHISEMIRVGEFSEFDDHFIVAQLRETLKELGDADKNLRLKIEAVLNRRAPKLVAASERIADRERKTEHNNHVHQVREKIARWAEEFDVPKALWHLWSVSLTMTKIGSHIPLSLAAEGGFEDDAEQTVRVLTTDPGDGNSKSKPLVGCEFALMNHLSNLRLYAVRLYVHLQGDDAEIRAKRQSIEQKIRHDIPYFPFSL
jgi:uncharacterized protein